MEKKMDYLKDLLKKTGWASILESLIFAILGIILVWKTESIMAIISYVIGAIFIAIGIVKIITYVQTNEKNDLFNYELLFGIMAVVIGIIIITHTDMLSTMFGIIVGIWIVYSSIIRALSALKLRVINSNVWIYSLILAVIMFICGMYVIFDAGIIVTTIGVVMIIYAVIDIIENVIFINNVKKI
jgi:uncharacterized membrane protein HdeD (DUF308 family)